MNKIDLTKTYVDDLQNVATSLFQKEALRLFKSNGIPTTKHEDWIYTKLTDVLPANFNKCSSTNSLKNVKVAGKYQLVIQNGIFNKFESYLPEELDIEVIKTESISNISEFKCIDDISDSFALLNSAASTEIILINVAKDVILDDIVSIVHMSDFDKSFATPRIHITCERFSNSNFVEIFTGEDDLSYNNLSVTNFDIKTGAITSHVKVQTEGKKAFHFSSVNAQLEKDANFKSFTFNTGAKKSRNNITVRLQGEGANASVDGLYAIRNDQHCDNFSLIAHEKPHTESSQLFKGILDDSARGVFTGKVLVCKNAQKVNSEQLNKNLLLSKKAHADSRPQLEVYADDVKCSHGATIGQMSEEESFYLMSRGLSKDRATKLLIHAFCSDVILKLENEKIENYLSEILFESFEKETFEKSL